MTIRIISWNQMWNFMCLVKTYLLDILDVVTVPIDHRSPWSNSQSGRCSIAGILISRKGGFPAYTSRYCSKLMGLLTYTHNKVTGNMTYMTEVIEVCIFCCCNYGCNIDLDWSPYWLQLNPTIMDYDFNYRYNWEVMFPITNVGLTITL